MLLLIYRLFPKVFPREKLFPSTNYTLPYFSVPPRYQNEYILIVYFTMIFFFFFFFQLSKHQRKQYFPSCETYKKKYVELCVWIRITLLTENYFQIIPLMIFQYFGVEYWVAEQIWRRRIILITETTPRKKN